MTSTNESVIQSFYPNKPAFFATSIFCAGSTTVFFHLISNSGEDKSGMLGFFYKAPAEILYFLFLAFLLSTIVSFIPLIPNSTYVRITNKGIIYKGWMSKFKEENISWKVIDDFYIYSFPKEGFIPLILDRLSINESSKYVKIKFKKTYLPNYEEKNLLIYGNPTKVLDIMKQNLIAYSQK
tara:strand:- start:98 stop:640 length:543 start_codon:yes stop_codon:yes gene_type:complete